VFHEQFLVSVPESISGIMMSSSMAVSVLSFARFSLLVALVSDG